MKTSTTEAQAMLADRPRETADLSQTLDRPLTNDMADWFALVQTQFAQSELIPLNHT